LGAEGDLEGVEDSRIRPVGAVNAIASVRSASGEGCERGRRQGRERGGDGGWGRVTERKKGAGIWVDIRIRTRTDRLGSDFLCWFFKIQHL
jgi:hypothetical protein